jgi:imidazole glycerol-phosphate synthase subunit HisH
VKSVAVIDYGIGNVNSVRNMLKKVGLRAEASGNAHELDATDALILPGVGSFGAGMDALEAHGLTGFLKEYAQSGRMLVGICLGMQLLGSWSDEAKREGLGLIQARFHRFDVEKMGANLTVPHMGWNTVHPVHESGFLSNLGADSRFYFVHSYFADEVPKEEVVLTATHGHDFVAAYKRDNVVGFQFHPEKSHRFGISLFETLFA